jgi:hypothetical protein
MKRPRQYIVTGEPVKVYFYFFGRSSCFSHDVHIAAVITKTGSPDRRVMGQSKLKRLIATKIAGNQ